MVDVLNMTGIIGAWVSRISLILGTLMMVTVFGGLTFFLMRKWKQYSEFQVRIFRKDKYGQFSEKKDRGGVFIKKATGRQAFYLEGAKIGLDPDNLSYHTNHKGKKIVTLLQTGDKSYRYIDWKFETDNLSTTIGDEDVNWMIDVYTKTKKNLLFDKLLQYMPYITVGFALAIVMVIMIAFFKELGVLRDTAIAFKEAAKALAAANAGTVVIS